MYLLGYDIGSSSIKVALVDAQSQQQLAVEQSPASEMKMIAHQAGWAEQDPEQWWCHLCIATKQLLQKTNIDPHDIKGIGIAYQMHGLVVVDEAQNVLRPSIIWCDSRAVNIGDTAAERIGTEKCLQHLLNSPGNFTASKLRWVQQNEPDLYRRIHKMMLPGDYIAMRLTGNIRTTISGLSEGMLWDFQENQPAHLLLDDYDIDIDLLPEIAPTFSNQGTIHAVAAAETGLAIGIPVNYRAGDQPNNALALNVLEAGEVAATGGTSGVVYGVVNDARYDPQSRVNGFAHVNHQASDPHIGILLCINGAGSQYRWIKEQMTGAEMAYPAMEQLAATVPIGADGLRILPFGNGTERMLGNQKMGATIHNLQFNRHQRAHFIRAGLEGIAFSFVYGMNILKKMGLDVTVIRVGNDNLFQSTIFTSTIANLMGSQIEVMETTGAIGAAKAAGVAVGIYSSVQEAVQGNRLVATYEPTKPNDQYQTPYAAWCKDLNTILNH